MINRVQQISYELIREDARFLYALTDVMQNDSNINSNYMSMALPYIGIFADGAEQWAKKVGLRAPSFTDSEKEFYTRLRQGHKFFEKTYKEFSEILLDGLSESDEYFHNLSCSNNQNNKYYNVGTDLCDGEFCGNTILCNLYMPVKALVGKEVGVFVRKNVEVAGKLAAFYGCKELPVYKYNDSLEVVCKDYHFYDDSPLKTDSTLDFALFSILCSINYVIVFIEKFFVDEIPQKLKYAYLQYYYLCFLLEDLNATFNTHYKLDTSLQNRQFRNCLAHYGLGAFICEDDIDDEDILRGLTVKAFNKDYFTVKSELYDMLIDLATQIKKNVII